MMAEVADGYERIRGQIAPPPTVWESMSGWIGAH
jgi:hypothetical protein